MTSPRSPMRFLPACAMLGLVLAAGPARAADPFEGGLDPEDLLQRLAAAVGAKDVRAFTGCLADSYLYVPYHSALAEYPQIDWKNWNREREVGFAREWILRGGGLEFGQVLERTRQGPSREEWDVICEMSAEGAPFRSRSSLVMVRTGLHWYLAEWVDTTQETDADGVPFPTCSTLRADVVLKR